MSMNVVRSPYPAIVSGGIPASGMLFEYKNVPGADNSGISSWLDSSANGRDLSQATAGAQPTCKTNILNGFSAARFDGGDNMDIGGPAMPDMSNMSFYAVMRVTNFSGSPTLMGGNNNAAQVRINSSGKIELVRGLVNVIGTATNTTLSTATYYTIAVIYHQDTPTSLKFYVNGVDDGVGSITNNTLTTTVNKIGCRNVGAEPYVGDLLHLIAYNRDVNSTENTDIHGTLRSLYAHY